MLKVINMLQSVNGHLCPGQHQCRVRQEWTTGPGRQSGECVPPPRPNIHTHDKKCEVILDSLIRSTIKCNGLFLGTWHCYKQTEKLSPVAEVTTGWMSDVWQPGDHTDQISGEKGVELCKLWDCMFCLERNHSSKEARLCCIHTSVCV